MAPPSRHNSHHRGRQRAWIGLCWWVLGTSTHIEVAGKELPLHDVKGPGWKAGGGSRTQAGGNRSDELSFSFFKQCSRYLRPSDMAGTPTPRRLTGLFWT
jgi:hypothetical protein